MQVMVGGGGIEKRMEALLDSGSEVNVISRVAAEDFKGNWKTLEEVGERSWSIRTERVEDKSGVVCGAVSKTGKVKEKGSTVLRSGRSTGGASYWKRLDDTVASCWTGKGGRCRLTWEEAKRQWNGKRRVNRIGDTITLIANRDYDVPPGYQMVIGVEEIRNEEFKGYSTKEGMVTPLRTKERLDQKFMVGYGYGGIDGKILVFNPMEKELRIRKGCRVAELHPGGKFSPAGISKENVETRVKPAMLIRPTAKIR
jgi:hypothetical protein